MDAISECGGAFAGSAGGRVHRVDVWRAVSGRAALPDRDVRSPGGFLSHLPVELIRNGSPRAMVFATRGVAVFVAIAVAVFHQGLKRYTSGNRFGVRA